MFIRYSFNDSVSVRHFPGASKTAAYAALIDELAPAGLDGLDILDFSEAVPVSALYDGLDTGNYADCLTDYRDDDGYICDIISEIADNHTSIYYSDILSFISRNPDALAEVVEEGLYTVGGSRSYNLYEHGQAAEYMIIERDIYDHMADGVLVSMLDYIRLDLELEYIPAELADLLQSWSECADNNNRMSDFIDNIREYLGI